MALRKKKDYTARTNYATATLHNYQEVQDVKLKAPTHDQISRQIFESNYLTQIFDAKFDGV